MKQWRKQQCNIIKSIKLTKMIPKTKDSDNRYVKTINTKSMVP